MDNNVHRLRQNAREGQWCPIGPTVRTGKVLISLPQTPPLKQDGSYRTIRAVFPIGRSESMETALVTVMNNAGS